MATRLDKVSRVARPERREERPRTSSSPHVRTEARVAEAPSVTVDATSVPVRRLTQATAAWLGLTFIACYFLLPGISAMLGTGGAGVFAFWPQYPAFMLVSAYVVTLVAANPPDIQLSRPSRDPVLAATLGSFGMWALLQQTLMPFAWMTTVSLTSLVALNLVESVLLGTMLASFADRPGRALSLGAGFQLAIYVVSMLILGIVV
ncbi:MAG: hypothetical protein AAF602_13585 [Myxococcota bacterium]